MSAKEYTEAWLPGPQSTAFYTRTYVPETSPKAVVVAVHGFAEHVGRYTHFHPLLAKKGIAVFAFDQRGFGKTALDQEGKKSKGSSWGKTCWAHQMEDVDWAVKHAKKTFEGKPIFLLGHSMGGAEVLGFACQEDNAPGKQTVSELTGVIATSPLITQTKPASRLLRWVAGKLSLLAPYTLIPTDLKPEELSHDEERNTAYMKDPLIKLQGTLKGVGDMLSKGEELLQSGFKRWPQKLPLIIIHGTQDQVTSHKSSEAFHNAIDAVNKRISLFEGGFHELQNEPDGVKERLLDEIVKFVEEHIPKPEAETPPSASPKEAPLETPQAESTPVAAAPELEGPVKANL